MHTIGVHSGTFESSFEGGIIAKESADFTIPYTEVRAVQAEPVYAGDGWPYNGDTINVIVYNSYNLSFIPTDKTCDILDYHGVFQNEINIEYQNLKRRYDGRVYAIAPHFVSGSNLQQGYIIKCGSVEDQGVKWRDVHLEETPRWEHLGMTMNQYEVKELTSDQPPGSDYYTFEGYLSRPLYVNGFSYDTQKIPKWVFEVQYLDENNNVIHRTTISANYGKHWHEQFYKVWHVRAVLLPQFQNDNKMYKFKQTTKVFAGMGSVFRPSGSQGFCYLPTCQKSHNVMHDITMKAMVTPQFNIRDPIAKFGGTSIKWAINSETITSHTFKPIAGRHFVQLLGRSIRSNHHTLVYGRFKFTGMTFISDASVIGQTPVHEDNGTLTFLFKKTQGNDYTMTLGQNYFAGDRTIGKKMDRIARLVYVVKLPATSGQDLKISGGNGQGNPSTYIPVTLATTTSTPSTTTALQTTTTTTTTTATTTTTTATTSQSTEGSTTTIQQVAVTLPTNIFWEQNEYIFDGVTLNWIDAEFGCQMYDAHLVSILSQQEMTFLSEQFDQRGSNFWIGLKRENWEPFSQWSDGNTLNFTHWDFERPLGSNDVECVHVALSSSVTPLAHLWRDGHCAAEYHYVCKKTATKTSGTVVFNSFTTSWNQHEYFFGGNLLQWNDAHGACDNLGGNLASVLSDDELDFLSAELTSRNLDNTTYWIGGYQSPGTSLWYWTDNTPWSYSYWYYNRPEENLVENCLSLHYDSNDRYAMFDADCDAQSAYVCKTARAEQSSTSTPTPLPSSNTELTFSTPPYYTNCDLRHCEVVVSVSRSDDNEPECAVTTYQAQQDTALYQIDCPLSESIGELKKLGCEGETMDFVLLVDVTVTERVHGYCWNHAGDYMSFDLYFNHTTASEGLLQMLSVQTKPSGFHIPIIESEHLKSVESLALLQKDTKGDLVDSYEFNYIEIRSTDGHNLQFHHVLDNTGNYALKLTTLSRGGHREVVEKKLLVASLDLTSSKRFFKVPSSLEFDGLYRIRFAVKHTTDDELEYRYSYDVDGILLTEADQLIPEYLYRLPSVNAGDCHNVTVIVSASHAISTILQDSFCVDVGMNITLNLQLGQTLGTDSVVTVNAYELGRNSCLAFSTGDGKMFILHEANAPHNTHNCISRELDISGHSVQHVDFRTHKDGHMTVDLIHNYQAVGDYNFRVTAKNDVHDQRETHIISVSDVDCESPVVEMRGIGIQEDLPVVHLRSESFRVELKRSINCIASNITRTVWTFNGGELFDQPVNLTAYLSSQVAVHMKPRVLSYGLYKVCSTTYMMVDEMFHAMACGFLQIEPSPLEAVIEGGVEVQAAGELDYLIDATMSRDPDEDESLAHVQVHFLCRSMDDPPFNLTLSNVLSFPYKSPSLENVNSPGFVSRGGCYGNGAGQIIGDEKLQVTLKTQNMIWDQTYELIIFMHALQPKNHPRTSFFVQKLSVVSGSPPTVRIKGLKNSGRSINNRYPNNYEVELESADGTDSFQFQWLLYKCSNEQGDGCVPVDHDKLQDMVSTDLDSLFYSTYAHAYEDNQWYKLAFRAYKTRHVFGESSRMLLVNENPKSGSCSISPEVGTVLIDEYLISCSGWQDQHQPLTYQFFTIIDDVKKPLCDSVDPECQTILPIGQSSEDYRLNVYASIMDRYKGRTDVLLNVTVNKPVEIQSVFDDVINSVTSNDSTVDVLLESKEYLVFSNYASMYTSLLNEATENEQKVLANSTTNYNLTDNEKQEMRESKLKRMQLREELLKKVDRVEVTTIEDINIVTGTNAEIVKIPNEIPPRTQETLLGQVDSFLQILDDDDLSAEDVQESLSGVINMASKVALVSSNIVDVVNPNDLDVEAVRSLVGDAEESKQKLLNQIKQAEDQLTKAQNLIGKFCVPGGAEIVVQSEGAQVAVRKVLPAAKDASVQVSGSIGISFDPSILQPDAVGGQPSTTSSTTADNNTLSEEVTQHYSTAKNYTAVKLKNLQYNPYRHSSTASRVKSNVVGITLETRSGEPVEVRNSRQPMLITIPNNPIQDGSESGNNSLSEEENSDVQSAFHKVEIRNESLRAVLNPMDFVRLDVYLQSGKRPTPGEYLFKWRLPDSSSCKWKNISTNQNASIDVLNDNPDQFICTKDTYSIFISDKEQLDGIYYLGIFYYPQNSTSSNTTQDAGTTKRRRRRNVANDTEEMDTDKIDEELCVIIKPPPPTPSPTLGPGTFKDIAPVVTNSSLNYSLSITKAKCLFWEPVNETWTSQGCVVGSDTTPELTHCLCDHLTDFGGDILVAPNPIDMNEVFEGLKNIGDNLGVLMVIVTLILLYVVLCVWARKKDRQDEVDSRLVTVDCTTDDLEAKQTFLLNVLTGASSNSGTTANVYCILTGSKGDSKIIPLSYQSRSLFKSRSTVVVKVLLEQDIGDLLSIRVFHDNKGRSPSWFLRSILITDLETDEEFPFVCEDWLAVECSHGQLEKQLHLAAPEEMKQPHLVFSSTISKGLIDGHIWFSVFLRPNQSTFTRVRRLTACLALIFLTMLTNAMFFGADDNPGSRKIAYLGNFKINFTGIIIGIQSSIIIIPPSLIIIEIFKRLGPRKEKKEGVDDNALDSEISVGVDSDPSSISSQQNLIRKAHHIHSEKRKGDPFLLPNSFKYLAYFLVLVSVASSSVICFFYSMMWGARKSDEWLDSMFMGFFQSVLVIQPLKAVFLAVLLSIICRMPIKHDSVKINELAEKRSSLKSVNESKATQITELAKEDEEEVEEGFEEFAGNDGIISADEIPIIRPTDSDLEKARKSALRDKITYVTIKEISIYVIFLIVVAKLAYAERDYHTFMFREDLVNMFHRATYSGPETMDFDQVSNHGYFYSWIRDTLIPGVFAGPWYNDEISKYEGFIDNHESLLVSIPRLRQLRVRKKSCHVPAEFKNLIEECDGYYELYNEDDSSYGIAWTPYNISNYNRKRRETTGWKVDHTSVKSDRYHRKRRAVSASTSSASVGTAYHTMATGRSKQLRRRKEMRNLGAGVYYVSPEALLPDGTILSCKDRWMYFTSDQLEGFPIPGRLTTYSGGGFIANLGYNEETSWTVLADLHVHNWLDRQTRAVFTEFTVYNGNVNLFATAFLYIETLPTGGAFPWVDFKVFNGYRYSAKDGLQSMWAEMLFIIFMLYYSAREISRMLKQGCLYFKSFFNVLEFTLMPLYIVMFTLIIIRWLTASRNIQSFKANPKDFVSFQYSAASDEALMAVMGIICFLLNIKFMRLMQFAKLFFVVGKVMKSFSYPLLIFTIPFTLYFLLFAWCAHLGFGGISEDYQTILRTITTQFLHLLGATDFEALKENNPIFGPLYYLAFSGFMIMICFNMFMAIICEAIDGDYDEQFQKEAGDIHVFEYMTRHLKDLLGLNETHEIRIDGEEDENEMLNQQNYEHTEQLLRDFELRVMKIERYVDQHFVDVDLKTYEAPCDGEESDADRMKERLGVHPFIDGRESPSIELIRLKK
ncbi:polycystin family receptor for egg jelly-like [Clytia hemisphaerica]|uniref:polycystin family receptor for egg jelly-like n=1 Tax=Clytia hemisphaerica TaxID=252671 RepID=UPI0034D4C158